MSSLVIVFPKIEDAKRIRDILSRNDFDVDAVCNTAAQALGEMNNRNGGVLICGYKLPDMFYTELLECIPSGFEMLLIASARVLGSCEGRGVIALSMPLSTYELVNTVQMMQHKDRKTKRKASAKSKTRSKEDQDIIDKAKNLLIERNHMTESEAHRYLQKCSMENGTNLVETGLMVVTLMSF